MYYKINAHELLRRVLFVMPLRWLQLSLCENKWIRTNTIILMGDATHLGWIHATTALALATTFEHLHFTILLHEHRLCIWLPADSYAYAVTAGSEATVDSGSLEVEARLTSLLA